MIIGYINITLPNGIDENNVNFLNIFGEREWELSHINNDQPYDASLTYSSKNYIFTKEFNNQNELDINEVYTTFTENYEYNKEDYDAKVATLSPPVITNPPVASAGSDRLVQSATSVTLTGAASTDSGGSIVSYAWTRIGGTGDQDILNGITTNEETLTFTSDTIENGNVELTHTFRLLVTDDDGNIATDTVTITINAPPLAIAGLDRKFISDHVILLDGSHSRDPSGHIVSYTWTRTGGTGAVNILNDITTTSSILIFRADNLNTGDPDVTHDFELTVIDEHGASDTDTITVTVSLTNTIPTVEAGNNQTVRPNARVYIEADAYDPDGSLASLSTDGWSRTGGTDGLSLTIPSNTNLKTSFFASIPVLNGDNHEHILTFTATDDDGGIGTDTITITVEAPTTNLFANAGSDMSYVGSTGNTFPLEGSRSFDLVNTISSYQWTRIGGTGDSSAITIPNSSSADTVVPIEILDSTDSSVTHIFRLTVTNDQSETSTDTVTITIIPPATGPTIDAGNDRIVEPNSIVQLNAIASDTNGQIISYMWEKTSIGGNITLINERTSNPIFISDDLSMTDTMLEHVFEVTVRDNHGLSATDTVTISVLPANQIPIITLIETLSVESGSPVNISPTIIDPDGDNGNLMYSWERTGGTINFNINLPSLNNAILAFTADTLAIGATPVTHEFTLTVTDERGGIANDTVTITVTPPTT